MNNIEFISYEETPSEQYFLGVATIRVEGKYIIRFKAVPKKDGSGFFPATANFGVSTPEGTKKYLAGFEIDSMIDNREMIEYVHHCISQYMQGQQVKQPQQQAQQQPSQGQQAQPQSFQPNLDACPF